MPLLVIVLSLASAFCFGAALVLTQIGLRYLSPLQGARISVPTTALLFLAAAPLAFDPAGWDRRAALAFALVGCLFPAAVTLLTFEANRRIGPTLTGALGNLTPLFAVLIAFVLLGEVPRPWQLVGVVVIVSGVLVLFAGRGGGWRPGMGVAVLLPVTAALIRGLVQPLVKLGMTIWPSAYAATTIGYVVSAAVILTVAAVRGRGTPTPVAGRRQGWPWFMLLGASNGTAVLLMYAALGRGAVALVAPLIACYPIVTLVLSAVVFRGTGFSARMIVGIAVTVAGAALLLAG